MKCPSCGNEAADDAPFCGVCYEVLNKKPALRAADPARLPPIPPELTPGYSREQSADKPDDPWGLKYLKPAAAIASVPALLFSLFFASYLPITEAWMSFKQLLILGSVNLAFHEAGHVMLGLGGQWIGVFGGTLFQIGWPAACLVHFWLRRNVAGVVFGVFWIGHNLVDVSFYLADAKGQNLILITGYSGSEGSFHDWGFLLESVGLRAYAVGLGRLVFFAGLWVCGFASAWGAALGLRRVRAAKS